MEKSLKQKPINIVKIVLFGPESTGKTTLSADTTRRLIGDDEHGWGDHGVFNLEGGCYAKVINLSEEHEPLIYATTRQFGTILENVGMDTRHRRLDLDDDRLTENTRASYPVTHIPNAIYPGIGGHPKDIVMLTCDAFGVLPPISRLTAEQAMYHFLSGYTAKVAGTEEGIFEPTATFSACFGAPFLQVAAGIGNGVRPPQEVVIRLATGGSGVLLGVYENKLRLPVTGNDVVLGHKILRHGRMGNFLGSLSRCPGPPPHAHVEAALGITIEEAIEDSGAF